MSCWRRAAELLSGQVAEDPQRVRDVLDGAQGALGCEPGELGLDFVDRVRVEQLAELDVAEQLGQQCRVECEGGGPPLGQAADRLRT